MMTSHLDRLSALDRATLRLWRASNIVGWGLLGGVLATMVHGLVLQGGFTQTAGYHQFPDVLAAGDTARLIGLRLAVGFIAGGLIGMIAGSRMWTRPSTFAPLVGLGYVVYMLMSLEHSAAASRDLAFALDDVSPLYANSAARALLHDAAILTAVPWAYLFAKRHARRRGLT